MILDTWAFTDRQSHLLIKALPGNKVGMIVETSYDLADYQWKWTRLPDWRTDWDKKPATVKELQQFAYTPGMMKDIKSDFTLAEIGGFVRIRVNPMNRYGLIYETSDKFAGLKDKWVRLPDDHILWPAAARKKGMRTFIMPSKLVFYGELNPPLASL